MAIDATIMTALAAGMGSLVGATASIVTTWITQRTQSRRANLERKLRDREVLYQEFITEASRLAVDSLVHSLERPDQLVALYGILSRIRLIARDPVLAAAEECCREIVDQYWRPNLMPDQIRAAIEVNRFDVVKPFSSACRTELQSMSSHF